MRVENSASPHSSARAAATSLLSVFRASKKRQDESEDFQIGIEITDKFCRLPDERESRQSVIFDLYRDEQPVRRIEALTVKSPREGGQSIST